MKIWKIISSRQILDPNLDQSFSILTSRSIEAVAGALGIQNGQAAASLAIAEKWDFNLAQMIIAVIFTTTTIITIITIIIISIITLIQRGSDKVLVYWMLWMTHVCRSMFSYSCSATLSLSQSLLLGIKILYLGAKYMIYEYTYKYIHNPST